MHVLAWAIRAAETRPGLTLAASCILLIAMFLAGMTWPAVLDAMIIQGETQ